MALEGKLVAPTEALRLRWRRWPGVSVESDSGTLRRAAPEVEFVDEVRGGIAAGDWKKALGMGPVAVDEDGWAAMAGWSFGGGRRNECNMGTLVEGSGRRLSVLLLQATFLFLPKVRKDGLVVPRWGRVSGAGAGDDMRFRLQRSFVAYTNHRLARPKYAYAV